MNFRDFAVASKEFYNLVRFGKKKDIGRLLEKGRLIGAFQITKFENDAHLLAGRPYLVGEPFFNQFTNAGLAAIWNLVTGAGGTAFNNAAAYLGVGDSTTAFALSQTDLVAGSNKLRVGMDATYPTAPTLGVQLWRATFGSAQANFHWQEHAMFNHATVGTMMNRKVDDQGTKSGGESWQNTFTITLA